MDREGVPSSLGTPRASRTFRRELSHEMGGPPTIGIRIQTMEATVDANDVRTEWLRFKSRLFDTITGLPTFPAVADDVRKLVESAGSVHVVYLDLGRSGWQETQLGWETYDHAVREFARVLGNLRQSGEIGGQDVYCVDTVRSDRFLVFVAGVPGDSLAAALRVGDGRRKTLLMALRAEIGAASSSSVLQAIRLTEGHAHVQHDPMVRVERGIQQAVTDAMLMSLVQRQTLQSVRLEELARMIAEQRVRSVFHPIVRLVDGTVIGHEALTRPLDGVPFDSVEDLFAFAETTELLMEFEMLCRAEAIRGAAGLVDRGLLFLNASARVVEDPKWSGGAVDDLLAAAGFAPSDVVIEITERVGIARPESFQRALTAFKSRGYRVAVDDVGSGHASLKALAAIQPDFLKCDVSLVRGLDRSRIKQGLLESLGLLAEKMHARVIAEGVEREEERAALVKIGIELGQGYLFHAPESDH
jgi:EAL domain-containing protein (putative c-di-GMP-specific phosphodiesterase class I)